MIKKYSRVLVLSLCAFIFIGCSSRLVSLEDSPDCRSTVEGAFYADPVIIDNAPNLVLKGDMAVKDIRGTIVALDSLELQFIKKSGALFSSDEIITYPLESVQSIIDDCGNLIYGTPPYYLKKEFTLYLEFEYKQNPNLNGLFLEIKPNETFAYCFPPGDYKVIGIEFQLNKKERHIVVDVPELTFSIQPNTSHYIGDIHFNQKVVSDYHLKLATKIFDESSASQAAFFGGLIGSARHELSYASADIENIYQLDFIFDDYFLSEANIPVQKTKFIIKHQLKTIE